MNSVDSNLVEKNITKVYIFTFLRSLIFVGPIMVLFVQSRSLDFKDFMLLQSLFAIATFLFEIPTGVLSDRLGRKKSIIFGSVFLFLGHIAFTYAHSFIAFLTGEMFFAIGFAALSGTVDAFVYDTLLELKQQEKHKLIIGKIYFIGFIAGAMGAIIGGFLAKVSLDFVFYANIVTLIFVPIVALTFVEPNYTKQKPKGAFSEIAIASKKLFFNGSNLKWIILFSSFIYAISQSAYWLYQPYLKLCEVDLVYFGFIFASFQLIAGFSSKIAHAIEAKLGILNSLILIDVAVSASLILMGSFAYAFSFLFIYGQQFSRGVKGVIISDIINKNSQSHYRATMLSLEGFASRVAASISMIVVGYAKGIFGVETTLIILGGAILVVGFGIILIIRSKHVVSK
jgi:MFS family permease